MKVCRSWCFFCLITLFLFYEFNIFSRKNFVTRQHQIKEILHFSLSKGHILKFRSRVRKNWTIRYQHRYKHQSNLDMRGFPLTFHLSPFANSIFSISPFLCIFLFSFFWRFWIWTFMWNGGGGRKDRFWLNQSTFFT